MTTKTILVVVFDNSMAIITTQEVVQVFFDGSSARQNHQILIHYVLGDPSNRRPFLVIDIHNFS